MSSSKHPIREIFKNEEKLESYSSGNFKCEEVNENIIILCDMCDKKFNKIRSMKSHRNWHNYEYAKTPRNRDTSMALKAISDRYKSKVLNSNNKCKYCFNTIKENKKYCSNVCYFNNLKKNVIIIKYKSCKKCCNFVSDLKYKMCNSCVESLKRTKCRICGNKTKNNRVTCSEECKNKIFIKNGKLRASEQIRRSLDEQTLAELCENEFTTLNNHIIADGWDADIVLPDQKIAVLWNGPWHYREMPGLKHSLKQVQNRDRIKTQLFESLGWTVLVYEDRNWTPQTAFENLKEIAGR